MSYKLILVSALLFSCAFSFADEKPECGLAVDAADRLSPDSDKDCDYTKTGLNGVLHRALSGNPKDDSDPKVVKESSEKVAQIAEQNTFLKNGEFKTAQQLQTLKFSLLEAAAIKCPAGFILDGESYMPGGSKAMKLELVYHCL
jgi:hypothetical protein